MQFIQYWYCPKNEFGQGPPPCDIPSAIFFSISGLPQKSIWAATPPPLPIWVMPKEYAVFFWDDFPNKTYLPTELQLTTPPHYFWQHLQKSWCTNILNAKFLRFGHSIAYPRGQKIYMKISLFPNYVVLSKRIEELPVTNLWSLANEKVVTHWRNEKSNRVLQQLTKLLIQECSFEVI